MKSVMCTGLWLMPPASRHRGQDAIIGVEMPPSCTQCLYRRKGVLEAFAHGRS